MKRALIWTGATVLWLALILVMAVSWLLGTETGSRWLLGHVPGLTVQTFNGRLGGHWTAEQLVWSQGGTQATLNAPEFDWSPSCLFKLTLCIDTLVVADINLDLPPSPETQPEESGPIQLPDLKLPLAIQVKDVRVGHFSLNGTEQFASAQLKTRWEEDGLVIEKLDVNRKDMSVSLTGKVLPSDNWPVTVDAQAQLPAPNEQPWPLTLHVEGKVKDSLSLTADSSGYFPGRLTGQVQPLVEGIPATLHLTADGFKPTEDLPDTLTLNKLDLTASGNLTQGYVLAGSTVLPGKGGNVSMQLNGTVTDKGATLAGLRLEAGENRHVLLTGQATWTEELTAQASIDFNEFPWQRLYPLESEPPVALRRLKGEVHYDNDRYLGNVDAAMSGPAGDFTLVTPFSGDLAQINLPDLDLRAGQGRAQGQVNVGFADAITWKADLSLSQFDPSYWVAQLPGMLAGPLRTEGELKGEQLRLSAELGLRGQLRGQPAQLAAQARGQGNQWDIDSLDIRLGSNRIQGAGQLAQQWTGRLTLELPRLGQLWPGLSGAITGSASLAGTQQAPQGNLSLSGRGIAYETNRLATLSLDGTLDARQQGRVTFKATGVQAGTSDIGTVALDGQGNRRQQAVTLDVSGGLANLSLALDGTLDEAMNWRGRLLRGQVRSGPQRWRLQDPAAVQRLASGELTLGQHCWVSGSASICGEDQRLMPEPKIRYRLRNFALASLRPYLPEDFAMQGQLDATIHLDLPASGPNGSVDVDAGTGLLRVRNADGQWVDFSYTALKLDSTLRPNDVQARFTFNGPQLGNLLLDARIDPRPQNKPLTGSFNLSGLNLAVAKGFVSGIEQLAGHIDGSGTLGGTLTQPQVNGRIVLSDGQIGGGTVPTRLEDLSLTAQIAGDQVLLNGGWRSGEQGQGQLSGTVSWAQALDMDISIKGTRLPVTVEPYADLIMAPDLHILMQGGNLALKGEVRIPSGSITVRDLPPSTVKVSNDAVIVGQETPEPQKAMGISMDVNVIVGQDKLSFSGFGLTANLEGQVHIGNNLDTRGELRLNDGRYRAYGQRLTIRRARIFFQGPIAQPYLDIEAVRVVKEDDDEITAGLRLSGMADQPRAEVFSDPAMGQEQALAYLVLGRSLNANDQGESNMLGQAALALGLAGGSSTAGELAQRLGVQNFQLDTEGSGDETSVVASGNLTDRLSIRYGVGVFESGNTVTLRYQLTRRLYIEVASGIANSLDFFYKRDF
ncbi:translocation and assembly module TamB [Pseudomonas duriflava]|uniref:Translocation and assembly module TamB n=1 Tax=Pseudomonas duriflava TaxID=459528 RepID=A0A562Q7T8_9PSED|nr:translocation/assembly module TamB domain-containing protein [Pseudomonas duriflava]TWI52764.1 translocation and assembly module TamB [Pseudomonas duriflava]